MAGTIKHGVKIKTSTVKGWAKRHVAKAVRRAGKKEIAAS